MLCQSLHARRSHLRESYIAISNYVRFGHSRTLKRNSCRPRDLMQRARLSTTRSHPFYTLRALKDRPRIPQDEDITQGFPEPPQSGLVPGTSERDRKPNAPGSNQGSEKSLPLDPGADLPVGSVLHHDGERSSTSGNDASVALPEQSTETEANHDGGVKVRRPSRQYKYMAPLEKATHTWEMLQEIQHAQINDSSYRVILHGYITGTRSPNRDTDFFNFVDPKLRTMVQVMVRKERNDGPPTSILNDVSANPLANHTIGEAKQESQALEDADPSNETWPKRSDPDGQPATELENDDASEDDAKLLVKQLAGSDVPTHQQTSPSTIGQSDDVSSDGDKKAGEDSWSLSNGPFCKNYVKFRPHTPVVIHGLVCAREHKPPPTPTAQNADSTRQGVIRRTIDPSNPWKKQQATSVARDHYVGEVDHINWLMIKASSITALNAFPPTIIAKNETNFPPEQRHLQLRTKHHLRNNLRARSWAMALTRKFMFTQGFDEIETPLLFKSTPEGAREFIVPTRKEGMAYALPQSPQQYKQILMASGISKYFQFAKCFRDEDMRADRQPEFTQLDLEMSFASSSDVMVIVEDLLTQVLWPSFFGKSPYQQSQNRVSRLGDRHTRPGSAAPFRKMTYQKAMDSYGSDKPDTRLDGTIRRIERSLPQPLKQMLSPLSDAAFEILIIKMRGHEPAASREFITKFLDAPAAAPYLQNPAGAPGITVVDPEKPLQGLASFGHTGAEEVMERLQPDVGDILIVQARPDVTHTGSSTPLGNLRRDIFHAAFADRILKRPAHDSFLWVVDFPLFSPVSDIDPGQGGQAGICSTHHPFTAPKYRKSIDLLETEPLSCIGDHYDLVINGVEIGGGSRRIHDSKLQDFILRAVLKMKPKRVEEFRHLLDALDAGCPPHAGFAFGFDRLMAILTREHSMRDVIAFPKWGDGEDKMVGAPTRMTADQLRTYHLAIR